MDLMKKDFFEELKKKRNIFLMLFIGLCIIFLCAYVFTFYLNILWISILTGIFAVIVLVLFYYGLVFDKNKLLKLYRGYSRGITQEDTYIFERTDDMTEHDGVRLLRLICSFKDENEVFERTLYFMTDLPYPQLEKGQEIKVKTHRNIIVEIEE